MKTKLLFVFFLTLLMSCQKEVVTENRSCATQENLANMLEMDPNLSKKMEQDEFLVQANLNSRAVTALNATIPVVVHVIYNTAVENISDAQIFSQIEALNKDFARQNSDAVSTPNAFKTVAGSSGIRFCLAKKDPTGKATNGIVRVKTTKTSWTANGAMKLISQGGSNAWDSKKYLNIWVCNLGGYLGYATYPGGNPIADGVVIRYKAFGTVGTLQYPYNKGRTATHEVGHWLNLYHIWGDAQCGDDKIGDTPKQERSNYGCPTFPHITCANGPNGDMYMNYMDYTNDACMNVFTKQQISRMEATLSSLRPGILSSTACQ